MLFQRCRPFCPFATLASLLLAISGVRAETPRPLMRDFIGLNGHTIQFKPDLYEAVCHLVRDYHPVSWDLATNTAEQPPFPFAKNRVDWNHVYGSWRAKEWNIDVCLMFESIERPVWKNIEKDAEAYGRVFAREFGPSGKRKLVDSVEIGNEPGTWEDSDYTRIFQSMAEGIRAGDPRLKIVTCNLATGKSGRYEKSVACVGKFPKLFDVLNVHTYAQLENWPTWRRSFPEDPKLLKYLKDVESLCAWRDEHAQGKPVWITEFGYDSSTKPAEKTGPSAKWVGVTDEEQAQWLVRSLLVFSAMPVERAYIYFFNDDDKPGLHASAGITRHYQPKPSYYALAHLQQALGHFRFHRVVTNEPGQLRVQEYSADSNKLVWAVWSPTGEGKTFRTKLGSLPGRLVDAERMPLLSHEGVKAMPTASQDRKTLEVEVTESPLYLFFEPP
jgi:hypothetical protein